MIDLPFIFSLCAMIMSGCGLLLAWRLTKRRPKWIDELVDDMFKKLSENPDTAKKVAMFLKEVLRQMREKEVK